MQYRLHFTDASLAQLEQLGLDQDAVRTVINAGWKLQRGENQLLCRHRGVEVLVDTLGPDYHVREVRREAAWPRRASRLRYLEGFGGSS